MNKVSIFLMATIALSTALFCSCKKDKPTLNSGGLEVKQYMQSRPTAQADSTDWVYFSFVTGKEVAGINEANKMQRTDWDLAFNRFYFRTNSGLSGGGKGGAQETNAKNMADVAKAPSEGYTIDEKIKIGGFVNGSPVEVGSTGNKVLANGIKFSGPPPTYTINNNVFVVKTADGKYAKLQFLSFHNANGVSGHVTMRYAFQTDGTDNIK